MLLLEPGHSPVGSWRSLLAKHASPCRLIRASGPQPYGPTPAALSKTALAVLSRQPSLTQLSYGRIGWRQEYTFFPHLAFDIAAFAGPSFHHDTSDDI